MIDRDALRDAVDRALVACLGWILVLVFASWFSNLPIYANVYLLPAITPVHWVGLTFALVAIASIARDGFMVNLGTPIVGWWFAVVLLNLLWFIGFGGGETVIITSRMSALIFLAVTYFAFVTMPDLRQALTRCLPWLVLLAVALNAYNLLNPFAFVPKDSEFAFMFRAAGIYINPNVAGAAIVLGMLLGMSAVSERWRALFICVSAAGVAMTLSRGAILMFLIVCVGFVFLGMLSRKVVWGVIAIVVGVVLLLLMVVGPAVLEAFGGVEQVERLMLLLNPGDQADFSQDERAFLAEQGWASFIASPLFGNGLGSTETWVLRASTHNQYLQFMSDFGFLGIWIMPGLALALVWGRSLRDAIPLAVAGCVVLWSFLSHNLLTEYFWIIAIALAAATPSIPRRDVSSNARTEMISSS